MAAVSGKRPTHLIPTEERRNAPDLKDQWLDIGAASREEARAARLASATRSAFAPSFVELTPDTFGGPALDDRVGVYVAVRALEHYAESPGRSGSAGPLHGAARRRVCLGARGQALRLRPRVHDRRRRRVRHRSAGDGRQEGRRPRASWARGPSSLRGSCSNKRLFALACEVAEAEGIPLQVKAYPAPTQTDADELQVWPDVGQPQPRRAHALHALAVRGRARRRRGGTARLVAALTRRLGEVYEPGYFVTAGGEAVVRVFISIDLEGISGVYSEEQTRARRSRLCARRRPHARRPRRRPGGLRRGRRR